jgi:hypothetical protein
VKWLGMIGVASLVTGCSIGGPAGAPPPGLGGMPCGAATRFAFAGETTLAALGLGEFDVAQSNQVAMIWVTADKVDLEGPQPAGVPAQPLSRVVCVQWPDGSGMAAPIDESWQPPAGAVSANQGIPTPLIALVAGTVLLGVASYFAFRRRPIAADPD